MSAELPPGPGYPAAVQGIGFWTRPLAFLERCRTHYGKRAKVLKPIVGRHSVILLDDACELRAAVAVA